MMVCHRSSLIWSSSSLLLLFLIVVCLPSLLLATDDPIERIVVVARHGDRAPLFPFSWDNQKNGNPWTSGYGHLTSIGKYRMHRIGAFLKRRYKQYFDDSYISPRDIYIQSSAVERCMETAQMIAAAMSPPRNDWIWNLELGESWQPVPVFTNNRNEDFLLYPHAICDKADRIYDEIPKMSAVKEFMLANEDIVNFTEANVGKSLPNYREVRDVVDSLLIVKHFGYKMPLWANETVYRSLKSIFDMTFHFDFTSIYAPQLKRLRAGVILYEIFQKLDPSIPQAANFSLYVTHDAQMFYLLDALGLKIDKTLKFGTTLMFESSRMPNGTIQFRMFFASMPKADDPINVRELKIPFCEKEGPCTLAFLKRNNTTEEKETETSTKLLLNDIFLTADQLKVECNNNLEIVDPSQPTRQEL